MTDVEEPLAGGASRPGIVRVGDTVRRPSTDRSAAVREILRQLTSVGVAGVPRWLGTDERDRDILTYLPGEIDHDRTDWSDQQLAVLARLVRTIHDALAGTAAAAGRETVCHNDVAPWNVVLRDDMPVALIDFDDAAPGRRVDDVAYLAWVFLGLGAPGHSVDEQARRIRRLCASYSGERPLEPPIEAGFVDAVLAQHDRIAAMRRSRAQDAVDAATRLFNADRAVEIERSRDWISARRAVLDHVPP